MKFVAFRYKFSTHPEKFRFTTRPSCWFGTPPMYSYTKVIRNTHFFPNQKLTSLFRFSLAKSPLIFPCTTTRSTENMRSLLFLEITTSCHKLSSNKLPTERLVTIPAPASQNFMLEYSWEKIVGCAG